MPVKVFKLIWYWHVPVCGWIISVLRRGIIPACRSGPMQRLGRHLANAGGPRLSAPLAGGPGDVPHERMEDATISSLSFLANAARGVAEKCRPLNTGPKYTGRAPRPGSTSPWAYSPPGGTRLSGAGSAATASLREGTRWLPGCATAARCPCAWCHTATATASGTVRDSDLGRVKEGCSQSDGRRTLVLASQDESLF